MMTNSLVAIAYNLKIKYICYVMFSMVRKLEKKHVTIKWHFL